MTSSPFDVVPSAFAFPPFEILPSPSLESERPLTTLMTVPLLFTSARFTPFNAPAASRETLIAGVGVLVGVVAQPARKPAISKPNVQVVVVRGEGFKMFP